MLQQGLRSLDDSDSCVFVPNSELPNGEIFALGCYVDNLQLVSSVIDDNGDAPPSSFCAKFLDAIKSEYDVIDEGPMVDLLGIQVRHNSDGSITLHQDGLHRQNGRAFPS
jgi:hypothetical protein